MSNLKDKDELKLWILRELGAPIVKVELTEEQLLDSIDNAIHWFAAKKGLKQQLWLQLQGVQNAYPLPPDVDTVTDVVFPSSNTDMAAIFGTWVLPGQNLPWNTVASHGSSMGLYSYWTQALQYIEMGKRALSAEPDWRQEGRILYLFGVPNLVGMAILEYRTGSVTIEQLNERDHDLVKRYSLARAMRILGRIRSKYDGFPTAQGTAQLDGSTLLGDAQAMLDALDAEIAASGFPMGFLVG